MPNFSQNSRLYSGCHAALLCRVFVFVFLAGFCFGRLLMHRQPGPASAKHGITHTTGQVMAFCRANFSTRTFFTINQETPRSEAGAGLILNVMCVVCTLMRRREFRMQREVNKCTHLFIYTTSSFQLHKWIPTLSRSYFDENREVMLYIDSFFN